MRTLALGLVIGLFATGAWASDWTEGDFDEDGYSVDEGDCDDGDPEINPGVKEVCEDEIDNDCDLAIDFEDPECTACGACSASPLRAPSVTAGLVGVIAVLLAFRRRGPAAGLTTRPASAPRTARPSRRSPRAP